MNGGFPPTALKARTGEFTPPGMTFLHDSTTHLNDSFGLLLGHLSACRAPVHTVLMACCANAPYRYSIWSFSLRSSIFLRAHIPEGFRKSACFVSAIASSKLPRRSRLIATPNFAFTRCASVLAEFTASSNQLRASSVWPKPKSYSFPMKAMRLRPI